MVRDLRFTARVNIIVAGFTSKWRDIEHGVIEYPAKIETAGIMADNAIRIIRRRVVICLTNSIDTVVTTNAIILNTAVIKERWQKTCRSMTVSAITCRINMIYMFARRSDAVVTPQTCP